MLGDTCVALTPTAFNLGAFLTSALVKKELEYNTSPSSSVEPSEPKKRRRGELSNPANTLDGLVARRADDSREPFQKRFLSEQEAIEGPDDELEMKKMESDPDVSTRTCSTCGYQGKWVSEMIRHKRVHTAERPFKCRYCSRTSKWKADLIRHVAKTHGIRVVSKYSRSKTFDPATTLLSNRPEDDKPRAYACEEGRDSPVLLYRPEPLSPGRRPLSYRCVQCLFEQDGLSHMINHLRTAHSSAPYECQCGKRFEDIETALGHAQKPGGCSSAELIVNITPIYNKKASSISSSFSSISPSGSRGDSSPDNSTANTETEEEDAGRKCNLCPFESGSQMEMTSHVEGHSSVMPYKCYFCSWSTIDRAEVEAHMRLHCQYPAQFMAPVEKNVPLSPTDSLLSLLNSPLDFTTALILLQQKMAYASPLVSPLALMSLTASSSAFTPVSTTKIHSCDRCDARFRDGLALSQHLAKHGSQSLFACPICDYSSARAANLVHHIQGHHNGGLVESQAEEPEDDVVDVETD